MPEATVFTSVGDGADNLRTGLLTIASVGDVQLNASICLLKSANIPDIVPLVTRGKPIPYF